MQKKSRLRRFGDSIYNYTVPILFIIGGIIDETTDTIVELLNQLDAPLWIGSVFRILVITFGAFKLYNSIPKHKRNITNYNKLKNNGGSQ